jgi:hypothetical protein
MRVSSFLEIAPAVGGRRAAGRVGIDAMFFRKKTSGGRAYPRSSRTVGGIIHSIGVGDQRVEQRANLQQLMPVAA